MIFSIPDNFNLEIFFAACDAGGVSLYKTEGGGEPDGFITSQGNRLIAVLYIVDLAKSSVITSAVEAQGGSLE